MFFPDPTIKTEDPVDSEADKLYVNKGLQMQWLQSHHLMFASCRTSALLFWCLSTRYTGQEGRTVGYIQRRREAVEEQEEDLSCLTPWQATKDKCKGICKG